MRPRTVAWAGLVFVLLVIGLAGYYYLTTPSSYTAAGFLTGTSVNSSLNTYFSSTCVITGVGGFSLRVVSDSTGSPVSGEKVNAIDQLGCGSIPQVVYLDNFSASEGGWLTPVFPIQATPAGQLNFTVTYQGHTYDFTTDVPPLGSNCVTLHVPSGSVATENVMNGSGSYCYQESSTTNK
jgi:hypothetical protein